MILNEFHKLATNKNIVSSDTVKKKINRWKTLNPKNHSHFTPKDFNELINNTQNKLNIDEYISVELIFFAIIFDHIYKESIDLGLSQEWIINEYNKYSFYQKIDFH